MVDWLYEGRSIETLEDMPEDVFGFVYCVTFEDGSKYIGKKQVVAKRTLPALKNGTIREGATRVKKNKGGKREEFDVITKESDWKTYKGSSKHVGGRTVAHREILGFASTNRLLTYLETKFLFATGCIEPQSTDYLNDNILGKFYSSHWTKG